MRKAYLFPVAILGIILSFSLWNSAAVSGETTRWQAQILSAQNLAQAENWSAAADALKRSYADWSGRQVWLHIVAEHDVLDNAEAMYHRAMAFAAEEDSAEFRSELSDLTAQLRLLAETELFSIKNIL